jgi:hypothetical protein
MLRAFDASDVGLRAMLGPAHTDPWWPVPVVRLILEGEDAARVAAAWRVIGTVWPQGIVNARRVAFPTP